MIALVDKTKCTGCTACVSACPTHCIEMEADREGFAYPKTDISKCIHCGRCSAVCQVEKMLVAPEPIYALGANAKNNAIRVRSSSGGVFFYLASHILKRGGVAYGAALQNNCISVRHECVRDQDDIQKLMGSKYVQSDVGDTFVQVKEQLQSGIEVLFTGTPCQIGGLKAFLGKEYENLICVSVICHGAPSPLLWNMYVQKCVSALGGELLHCDFRNKKHGWNHFGLRIESSSGKKRFTSAQTDPYMRMFLKNISLRPSCYQCSAKSNVCGADIVIGDFWGVEKRLPKLADDLGTSLILVYSTKGEKLIKAISENLVLQRVNAMEALLGNRAFSGSVAEPSLRNAFFADLQEMSFDFLAKKYVSFSAKERVKLILDSLHILDLVCRILGK